MLLLRHCLPLYISGTEGGNSVPSGYLIKPGALPLLLHVMETRQETATTGQKRLGFKEVFEELPLEVGQGPSCESNGSASHVTQRSAKPAHGTEVMLNEVTFGGSSMIYFKV